MDTPKNVIALLSGGKDSLYNMYLVKKNNHKIVAIANLRPPLSTGADELDSFMYQTVGHQAIEYIAQALELPLFRGEITGQPENKDLDYEVDNEHSQVDEVEQLYNLLCEIRNVHSIQFDAVSVGAIASSYQKSRVENICKRLNIDMLAYLWNQNQDQLLQSMIDHRFDAILIKVACIGLNDKHVGKSISDMQTHLRALNKEYGANICGEGGEYETLVLDCPMYKKRLDITSREIVCHSRDSFAPVYYLRPVEISLVDK